MFPHRSLIARDNISESTRLRALKELAVDFDKGGFVDKAIETYKDVLKINRDQFEVISSLCRIYEDIEDWDSAYNFRIMLSKVGHENQAETISHILVQKAIQHFEKGDYSRCTEDLEDAFRFAPSVSAKILQLKLYLVKGNTELAKSLLIELIKEHPMYASFIFVSLDEGLKTDEKNQGDYLSRLEILKNYFLGIKDSEILNSPSVILSKVRLLKASGKKQEAYEIIKGWMEVTKTPTEVIRVEYIKLLIDLGMEKDAVEKMSELLNNLHKSISKHTCSQCGYNSDAIFWRCPQCHSWETIKFRWKV